MSVVLLLISVFTYQANLTDADRKQILSLLFQPEQERTILLSAPVWLRVSYEVWPFNVENFKKGLGGTLRERWKKHGALYLEEKVSDRWFARLTSEPIELDLRTVELR